MQASATGLIASRLLPGYGGRGPRQKVAPARMKASAPVMSRLWDGRLPYCPRRSRPPAGLIGEDNKEEAKDRRFSREARTSWAPICTT